MRKSHPVLVLAAVFLFAAVLGCRGKIPPMSSIAKPLAKTPDNIIDNFEDGNTIMNTSLRGAPAGTWTNYGTSGQATGLNTTNYVLANTFLTAPNTSPMAAHVMGSLTDPANASYPEITLQGRFNVAPYYDASSFTGVKYHILIGASDTATKRRFKVTIAKTVPIANGGVCTVNCWDHFGLNIPGPTGGWIEQSLTFATASREGWGSPITPNTFTGTNVQELIGLDWAMSRNNMAGTSTIDFWVDNVEFF
jgi:hypothetical protein